MAFNPLLLLVLAAFQSAFAVNTGWIEYTFSSGIYCSSTKKMCSRLAHVVFWVENPNPLTNVIGGGYIQFLGNESQTDWTGSSAIEFEQHCFSLSDPPSDSTRVQAYNFMVESLMPITAVKEESRWTAMDINLFLNIDDGKHDMLQYLKLPQPIPLKEVVLDVPPNPKRDSFYDHGNSTIECSRKMKQCRLQIHVVWKYAPKGDFMENYNYMGSGDVYINNETLPERDGTLNVVWEKSMVLKNDLWYHGSNWGYDQIGEMKYLSEEVHTVCWKIHVMELQGTTMYDVPMDGGYGGYQKSKYVRCFEPEVHYWD